MRADEILGYTIKELVKMIEIKRAYEAESIKLMASIFAPAMRSAYHADPDEFSKLLDAISQIGSPQKLEQADEELEAQFKYLEGQMNGK